jgi:CRP/FNR family transcriptional regulator, nitrogen oxide reductase regulator
MYRSPERVSLHQVEAFGKLERAALRAVEEAATLCQLKPSEVLFHQGELATSFYVILEGGIRLVEYTEDGQAVTLKVFGREDIFGLLSVSGPYPYPSEARSIGCTLVAAISGENARRLMEIYPCLALLVIDLLVTHVHQAHHRIRSMAAERVDRRIARALLHYGQKFGVDNGLSLAIGVAVSQQDIAEYSGTTVETVNRTLKNWEKQGFIRASRQRLEITNPPALMYIAEDVVPA